MYKEELCRQSRAHLAISTEWDSSQTNESCLCDVIVISNLNIATIIVWTVYQSNFPLTNQSQLVFWYVTMTTGVTWSLSKLTGFIATITHPRLLESYMVTTDLTKLHHYCEPELFWISWSTLCNSGFQKFCWQFTGLFSTHKTTDRTKTRNGLGNGSKNGSW